MNERNIINFLALLFVVIGTIAFGSTVFSVTRIDQELDHAQGSHAASLNHLLALKEDFADSVQESFAYVVSGEIEEKQEAIAIQSGLAARLHEAQHALAHGHAGGAEHTRYEGLEQQLPELQQAAAAMYAEYEATGGVSGGTFHAYEAKVDAIGTSLDQLIATAQADADRAREQTVAAVAAAEWLVLGQGAAVIIVVLVAAFIASRVLRRVFESRAQALDDIKIHRQAIESAPLGITFADAQRPHLPLVYTNATFEEMTGFRARDGVATDSSDDSIMAKVQAAVQAGQEVQTRIEGVGPTGERFTADLTVTPVHDEEGELVRFVVIVQDVTERLDLEAQLRQSQKMDAVGQLAGGIAHDFNNYLTVINGTASLLAEGYVDDAEQCGREILEAGERSADLTRQILAFARKQILAPQPHDLNQIVRAIVPLMRKTVREDLALQTDFTTHAVTASVDRSQVEQVITNLVLNARDATQPGGTVTISTAMTELPEGHTRAGRWATLAVTDNGTGIDPSIRETLFEPFVTTKGSGEGTGLGLSTVYGIAEQSGGWITSPRSTTHPSPRRRPDIRHRTRALARCSWSRTTPWCAPSCPRRCVAWGTRSSRRSTAPARWRSSGSGPTST